MGERLEGLIRRMARASDFMLRAETLVVILLPIAAFSLVLGACQRASPSPEPPTAVVEVESTPRPEATIEPSATPRPTMEATATPPPLPSETAAPPTTPEPEPTPDGPATVMAIAAPTRQTGVASPDGRWQAELAVYPCSELPESTDVLAYERLNIVDVESGAPTKVADQLISCGGLGASGLESLFWSANSRYLYFTTAREGFPDGCGYWQRPLLRYEVDTGENEWLGPGERSPDGMKIAAWQERDLVIWESGGGEIGRVPAAVPDADLGTITWSPAGDALVYLQAPSYCPLEKSYVVHLKVAEMAPTVLLEAEAPAFGDVTWMDAGSLRLLDAEGEARIYDLASGDLSPTQ